MTYFEQLNSNKWQKKRKSILLRDEHTCQKCQNKKYLQYSGSPAILEKTDGDYWYYKIEIRVLDTIVRVENNGNLTKKVFMYYDDNNQWIKSIAVREHDVKDYNYVDNIRYRSHLSSRFEETKKLIKEKYERAIDRNEYLTNHAIDIIEEHILSSDDSYQMILDFFTKDYPTENVIISQIAKEWRVSPTEVSYYLNTEDEIYKFPKNEFRSNFKWLYAKNLHIHHKYYQQAKLAWEYPDNALTTLCWSCHEELHENEEVNVYDIKGNLIGLRTSCYKCFGAGYLPKYNHIENGVCFRCNGTRFENF